MSIKVATVCTGVGAPEQAIKELGWKHSISFGCEIDKYARTTYQTNFEPHAMFEDMTKESWIGEQYESDLFVGGIPCQAFSLAGKRLGELDPRGLLFYNFYDYVKKQRPKVFIIENVKGLLSDDNGKTFQNWLQLLGKSVNTQGMMFPHPDSLEYNLHWTVLNAKDFGLPQNRERVFLVGIRPDLPNTFRFPVGWTLDLRLKDVLESNVDEKYYLSDKMLNYLNTRKNNFNGGKINYKYGDDVANCINASSKSLDISDNIIVEAVLNDKGKLRKINESSCLDSNYGKGIDNHAQRTMIMETEPICVAMRGRDPKNPSNRSTGAKLQQTLEPNSQGITNTLTSVQKDNLILVGGIKEGSFHEGGKTEDYPQAFRVYDEEGLSSTLSACGGGMGGKTGLYQVKQINPSKESNGVQPYQQNRVYDSEGIMPALTSELSGRNNIQVIVKEGTKKGYAIAQEGDSIQLSYPNSETRRGRVGGQIAHTIETVAIPYVVQKRIRRLTPRECFRLQGFPESFDISHVSETQAYKQAGNSIPVTVLKEILKNLNPILQ
jgi:DNA (cytosine-5)-methyltransferase 1